jgi:signal transduction histidine kinase
LASNFYDACTRAGRPLIVGGEALPRRVYVDHEMWRKIVLNQLSNAFKFTLYGAITVSLRSKELCVELTMRDTGVGGRGYAACLQALLPNPYAGP